VHRDWAPHGADRLFNLVKLGYYDDVAFFRVIRGFMGSRHHGEPSVNAVWRAQRIPDDPVTQSNTRARSRSRPPAKIADYSGFFQLRNNAPARLDGFRAFW